MGQDPPRPPTTSNRQNFWIRPPCAPHLNLLARLGAHIPRPGPDLPSNLQDVEPRTYVSLSLAAHLPQMHRRGCKPGFEGFRALFSCRPRPTASFPDPCSLTPGRNRRERVLTLRLVSRFPKTKSKAEGQGTPCEE